jgi:hypothetical protein
VTKLLEFTFAAQFSVSNITSLPVATSTHLVDISLSACMQRAIICEYVKRSGQRWIDKLSKLPQACPTKTRVPSATQSSGQRMSILLVSFLSYVRLSVLTGLNFFFVQDSMYLRPGTVIGPGTLTKLENTTHNRLRLCIPGV